MSATVATLLVPNSRFPFLYQPPVAPEKPNAPGRQSNEHLDDAPQALPQISDPIVAPLVLPAPSPQYIHTPDSCHALYFHPRFEHKLSDDDIILQSTSGLCFYFPLPRLTQTSRFFNDLCGGMIDVSHIMELPHATADSLAILLEGLKPGVVETVNSHKDLKVDITHCEFGEPGPDKAMLKLLMEIMTTADAYDLGFGLHALKRALKLHVMRDPYDMFAFLAIMNEDDEAVEISMYTLPIPFKHMSPEVSAILLAHRPTWYKALKKLHDEHTTRLVRVRTKLACGYQHRPATPGWSTRCLGNGDAKCKTGCPTRRLYLNDYARFRRRCADAVMVKIKSREFDLGIAAKKYYVSVETALEPLVKCKRCKGKMSELLQFAAKSARRDIDWTKRMTPPPPRANTRGVRVESEERLIDTVPNIFDERPDPSWRTGEDGEAMVLDSDDGDVDSLDGMWSSRSSMVWSDEEE